MKITASCLWTWFADIRLRFQQTKHLQCAPPRSVQRLYTINLHSHLSATIARIELATELHYPLSDKLSK